MKTIRTWWGRRFIEALEQFTDSGRLARGRGYANNDRILNWKIGPGHISAVILGNRNPYYGVYEEPLYHTHIKLSLIAAKDWDGVIGSLGSQAAFVSRLLMKEVPDNIEAPFRALDLSLLPQRAKDLKTECSCPDYENPCKHIAGLCYFLAAKLDQDPFLLFELRGLERSALAARLRDTPLGRALADALSGQPADLPAVHGFFSEPEPAAADSLVLEDFWRGHKRLPESIEPASPPAVSGMLVKKGGDFPGFWPRENSFIEAMEGFYEAVRKGAKDW